MLLAVAGFKIKKKNTEDNVMILTRRNKQILISVYLSYFTEFSPNRAAKKISFWIWNI